MDKTVIEAKINAKMIKLLYVCAIVFFVTIFGIPIGIISLICAKGYASQKLIVTENSVKCTYGLILKKNIDLPIDSINSVGFEKKEGVVKISTSSEKIEIVLLTNAEEIANVINDLIKKRQKSGQPTVINEASSADELAKFKKLLDSGIITQEEFDAKKKQLLGL